MNVSPAVLIIVITGCWKQVYLSSCYVAQGSEQIYFQHPFNGVSQAMHLNFPKQI